MAHLWKRAASGQLDELPLDAQGVMLDASLWLRRAPDAAGDVWVLLAAHDAGVLVNGMAVPTGIHVLDHRDEIRRHDGAIFVFSDEHPARIVPYPGAPHPVRCARCTCDLAPSTPAVRCPACGSWYHEHGDFPCWTSVAFCQACGHATGLSSASEWTPEDI